MAAVGGRPPRKEELSGQLTPLAQKRITRERQKIEQERKELEDCGIYTCWAEEIHKSTALIVGPSDTPYEHGFYFFDVQIPDNYPLQPPYVQFKTSDGRVRFNPNLYENGKVCLSILGTWQGPSWSSSCNLRTVLVSIQSLLNEHPIQNEPGHEKEKGENDQLYSEIIGYENIAVGVVRMLKQTPPKFAAFRPQMRRLFLKHFDGYLKTLERYQAKEGQSVQSPIWKFQVKYQTKSLVKELRELREVLLKEDAEVACGEASQADDAAASNAPAMPQEHRGTKRPAPEV